VHLTKLLQILSSPENEQHVVHVSAVQFAENAASISAEEHTPLSLEVHQFREMDVAHFDDFAGVGVGRTPTPIGPSGASEAHTLGRPSVCR